MIVVNEGDTLHFTLENMDPAMDHSMDFHAVHTAPNKGFADVKPHENGTFVYQASSPGVFMYHVERLLFFYMSETACMVRLL